MINYSEKKAIQPVSNGYAGKPAARAGVWKPRLRSGNREFIAIEFERYLVKQIWIERNGSRDRLKYLKVKFLSSENDAEVTRALQEHLLGMGPPRNLHVTISIPRHSTHAKILRLPSQQPDELQKMIGNYMQKEIPLPPDEIVSDFRVVRRDDEGYAWVMVIMARKGEIERYLALCESVGLIVDAVRLNIEATYQAFMQSYQKSLGAGSRCVAMVDVDFSSTNMLIINQGDLSYCRTIGQGIGDLIDRLVKPQSTSEYDIWIDELCQGVNETLAMFEASFGAQKIDSVIMSGWLPRIRALLYRMQDTLDVPVDWFDPTITLRAFAETQAENVNGQWFSISALLGMALAPPGDLMDIRPREARQRQHRTKLIRKSIHVALLFVYLLVLSTGAFAVALQFRQARLQEIEAKIAELQPQVASAAHSQQLQQILQEELGSPEQTSVFLAQFFEKLSPAVRLSSLTFARGKQIIVRGEAKAMSEVITLSQQLGQQPGFREVAISSANRAGDGRPTVTFALKIQL